MEQNTGGTTDAREIIERGVENVKRILAENFVRPDEAQKILSVLRSRGSYTVIDKITSSLNLARDIYTAEFSNLGLTAHIRKSSWRKSCIGSDRDARESSSAAFSFHIDQGGRTGEHPAMLPRQRREKGAAAGPFDDGLCCRAALPDGRLPTDPLPVPGAAALPPETFCRDIGILEQGVRNEQHRCQLGYQRDHGDLGVDGGAGSVLERVAHGIADDGCLVGG